MKTPLGALLPLALLCALTLAACGDDGAAGSSTDNNAASNNTNNSTENNAGTNNSTENNSTENNAATNNSTANNSTTNNSTANNSTANNSTANNSTVDNNGQNNGQNNASANNSAGDGCPDEVFLDLANVEGAGEDYPRPSVEVSCSADTMTVRANGIPHYEFMPVTPNALRAQDHVWEVPLYPEPAAEPSDIPLLGVAAFTINGIPIYGPNEGPTPDPFGDPIYNDIVDWCLGHTAQQGDYHYHALLVECFFPDLAPDQPDPILGYALDGFPIYGPRGCVDADCAQVVEFKSSWEQTGDPSTYAWDNHACTAATCQEAQGDKLDRCNGRVGPDGRYRYHATTAFPYILGCYRGTAEGGGAPDPNQNNGGPDNNQTGPQTCEQEADCEGACGPDAQGCACHANPQGQQLCVPTCDTDADCPTGPMGALRCDANQGVCLPNRP